MLLINSLLIQLPFRHVLGNKKRPPGLYKWPGGRGIRANYCNLHGQKSTLSRHPYEFGAGLNIELFIQVFYVEFHSA